MTQEQKLGLIIGFAVVLVFGVLLADHLSRAHTESLVAQDMPEEPLVIPSVSGVQQVQAGVLPMPIRTAAAGSLDAPSSSPGIRTASSENSPTRLTVEAGVPDLSSIFGPLPQDAIAPAPGRNSDASSAKASSEVLPGFVPVEPRPRIVEPSPASERTHRVARGETLFALAERYYGSGHYWRELAKANVGSVDARGGVDVGVVISIPPIGGQAGVVRSSPTAALLQSEVGTYTVKAGDTLSEISQKLLGSMRRMDEIIRLNRDQISDADDIREGMVLKYQRGPQA